MRVRVRVRVRVRPHLEPAAGGGHAEVLHVAAEQLARGPQAGAGGEGRRVAASEAEIAQMQQPRQHAQHGAYLLSLQAHSPERCQRGLVPRGIVEALHAMCAAAKVAQCACSGFAAGAGVGIGPGSGLEVAQWTALLES